MSEIGGLARKIRTASDLLAALGSLVWLALGLQWLWGTRKVPVLRDLRRPGRSGRAPALSVILAARDEERSVGASVESLLAQDYPGPLEMVAVDDRSADRTGEILDGLAAEQPGKLRVVHVGSLPEGWLGKTHALHAGATRATGEWLLFTDADVVFSPACLDRAVQHAADSGLDHLALAPEIISRSVLLRGFVASFALVFEMTQRPWRVGDPRSREHVGVGAFNLIKRNAYQEIGTHRAIRMRPDDDMKLAKLVKRHGFRQGVAHGTGLVTVEWHQSLRGAVRGLGKSFFPGLDYSVGLTLAGVLMLALTNVFPVFGVFSRNAAGTLSRLGVASTFLLYAWRARSLKDGTPWWYAGLHTVGICVFIYAMLRSAFVTILNGGIEWRGTRYSLDELRDNEV